MRGWRSPIKRTRPLTVATAAEVLALVEELSHHALNYRRGCLDVGSLNDALGHAYDLGFRPDLGDGTVSKRDLAHAIDSIAVALRRQYQGATVCHHRVLQFEDCLLSCLARLLPIEVRSRFVAEALGNLGECEHWRQRGDHLVCLAVGTPRLAWMMWREGRRGRA
jgi:hypothetical protein